MVGHKPTQSIASFLERHPSDLVVFATHGRDGIQSWLKGSVSETVLRWSAIPALFISPSAHGFISQVSGDITLRRVLIPVDFSPAPGEAIQTVQQLVALLASANVVLHILHVGTSAPSFDVASTDTIFVPPVLMRSGDVVESIIGTALPESGSSEAFIPPSGNSKPTFALSSIDTTKIPSPSNGPNPPTKFWLRLNASVTKRSKHYAANFRFT
jgi:nucleotide-binding universal stress UspA family protein